MPANLTPEYRRAEGIYRQASTVTEKTQALEHMLRVIPKHKGTDHIRGDIRHRLAKLRAAAGQKQGKAGIDPFHVEKQGAGQIAVVGMPNTGKSALVAAVSKARVNVAPFPFATHAAVPGMMPFEDVQIQLVDLPPVTVDGVVPGMMGTLWNADALLVCIDLAADDLLEQADMCFAVIAERGLARRGRQLPEEEGAKPMLTVGTKVDMPGAPENLQAFRELRQDLEPVLATSAERGDGLDELAPVCFEMLDIVRAYSKQPGKPPDTDDPFTLPRGSTVSDLARAVHRELAESLKYARIWGSGKFDGQTVNRDHVLVDRDVIELHG